MGIFERFLKKKPETKQEATNPGKKFSFVATTKGSRLVLATLAESPKLSITYRTTPQAPPQTLRYDLDTLDIKGWKAAGSRLTNHAITQVVWLP